MYLISQIGSILGTHFEPIIIQYPMTTIGRILAWYFSNMHWSEIVLENIVDEIK